MLSCLITVFTILLIVHPIGKIIISKSVGIRQIICYGQSAVESTHLSDIHSALVCK